MDAESPSRSRIQAGMRLPRAFGRYTLFDYIGKGGMAEIYLARASTALGGSRHCVVKQILVELACQPQFAEMLIHEAKLAAHLNHAHVVQVFDLGREDGQLYIAMEYVEGYDLNALLRRCSREKIPLPVDFALFIVASALSGLDYAHRRNDETGKPLGIVHRDVSPSNILISFEGDVKVCDFGIAHANDIMATANEPSSKIDDAIKGKAGYMSPEQARGDAIDARADVFAAGIVLWELLSGRRMYRDGTSATRRGQILDGTSATRRGQVLEDTSATRRGQDEPDARPSLLEQAQRAEIPPLVRRNLPEEPILHGIVMKALARERDDRYPSAAAMLRDLEAYVVASRRVVSPLKLGEWMAEHFGQELITVRRARERVAQALAKGPAVVVTPIERAISEESESGTKGNLKPAPLLLRESLSPPSLVATSTDLDGRSVRDIEAASPSAKWLIFAVFVLFLGGLGTWLLVGR